MDGSIAAADSSVDPSVAADSVSASDSDSDVAPEMTEELAEELEALDAIFGDEMTVVEPGRAFAFALPELAAKLGTQIAPDPKLSLELPRGYPDVPVRVRARRGLTGVSPNLARALTTGVANAVEMAARPLLGSPAVYSVVTEAREWLDAAADGARTKDEGDEERRPGNDAGSGSRARDDDDSDALDDVTDVTETSAARWWEREETDAAAVTAATAAASATEHSLRARGAPAPCVAAGGRWNFTVGLVGKPSAGKSSFFNAATEAAEGAARAARVAPHPFTTIEPNLGAAFAPATCPCALVGLDRACDPSHGAEDVDGTHCRRIPILVKDVAGLVPGAHAGRGRGNAFLNDLCDADVLVHVVDASGRSDREGVDHSGGDADAANGANGGAFDPGDDVQWVREELHHWIFGNARRKWSSVHANRSDFANSSPGTTARAPRRTRRCRARGFWTRRRSPARPCTDGPRRTCTSSWRISFACGSPCSWRSTRRTSRGRARERRRFASDGPKNPRRRSARYAARGFEGCFAMPSRWDESRSGSRWRTSTRARRRARDATRR